MEGLKWRSLRNDPPPLDGVAIYRGPTRKIELRLLNARYTRYRGWVYLTEWVMAPWRTKYLLESGFTKWMLVATPVDRTRKTPAC